MHFNIVFDGLFGNERKVTTITWSKVLLQNHITFQLANNKIKIFTINCSLLKTGKINWIIDVCFGFNNIFL